MTTPMPTPPSKVNTWPASPTWLGAPSPTTATTARPCFTSTSPMPSRSAIASSRCEGSSTVTEIETSEVVTRSTTMWCRPNTSNTRARKPCASSIRVETMVTAVTSFLHAIDLTRQPDSAASAPRVISDPGSSGRVVEHAHVEAALDRRQQRLGVEHLGAEVRQLARLGEREPGHRPRLGDDPRIGREQAAGVGPDLDLLGAERGADHGCAVVRAAA